MIPGPAGSRVLSRKATSSMLSGRGFRLVPGRRQKVLKASTKGSQTFDRILKQGAGLCNFPSEQSSIAKAGERTAADKAIARRRRPNRWRLYTGSS